MTTTSSISQPSYYRFKPWNVGRWSSGPVCDLLLIVAPCCFTSSLSLTMLSQMGIAIIICLSYNMLLGQGGMLSFGHAVYTGLGSFVAIHAMNWPAGRCRCRWPDPAGGRPGGHVLRRAAGLRDHQEVGHHLCHDHAGHGRAGVRHVADVPRVLRRRGGITGNRVYGKPFLGITFGPRCRCIT
jgi:branched-chain amino acid transport system permease protein